MKTFVTQKIIVYKLYLHFDRIHIDLVECLNRINLSKNHYQKNKTDYSLVIFVDFYFVSDVLLVCKPIKKQFHENFDVVLKEKLILLEIIHLIILLFVIQNEIVYVVYNVSDRLLLQLVKSLLISIFSLFFLIFYVFLALILLFVLFKIFKFLLRFENLSIYFYFLFLLVGLSNIFIFLNDLFFFIEVVLSFFFQVFLVLPIFIFIFVIFTIPILLLISSLFDILWRWRLINKMSQQHEIKYHNINMERFINSFVNFRYHLTKYIVAILIIQIFPFIVSRLLFLMIIVNIDLPERILHVQIL